ncbi:MAG: hypothetical protein J6S67_15925 [Methanobrevibacter sp.]|nr:hypothetical protein [Methanobrevibacter sp.]
MWLTILLVISNVCLWIWLIYEERWSIAVDEELDELRRRDKLKLNSAYGTMVSNLYHDTDSVVDESEE